MRCAWEPFWKILPRWMQNEDVAKLKGTILELRLRTYAPVEIVTIHGSQNLSRIATAGDLQYCVNAASEYSPWMTETLRNGYITIQGGHRIGVCGEVSMQNGKIQTIRNITSLCIRVARDFPGIADKLIHVKGSLIILGKPGSGKTTLLRDYIRLRSNQGSSAVAVIDEKQEIFPRINGELCFNPGSRTDLISGCTKSDGLDIALRNMGAGLIAVDEITSEVDCQALMHAGWCGVDLVATAHAANLYDLHTRKIYKPLTQSGLFQIAAIMQLDKSWQLERITQ